MFDPITALRLHDLRRKDLMRELEMERLAAAARHGEARRASNDNGAWPAPTRRDAPRPALGNMPPAAGPTPV